MNSLVVPQNYMFSQYFKEMDKKSTYKMMHEYYYNKQYKRIMDQWQKPLEKKKIKREKKLLNPKVPNEDQ